MKDVETGARQRRIGNASRGNASRVPQLMLCVALSIHAQQRRSATLERVDSGTCTMMYVLRRLRDDDEFS